MSVRHDVARTDDADRIACDGRTRSGLIQERTPLSVKNSKLMDIEVDANPVSPVRELELKRGNFERSRKSSERQARDTTGLGVYSCRPDLPFVSAF